MSITTKNTIMEVNNEDEIQVLIPEFFTRSKSMGGDFAKMYFVVLKQENTEPALIVRKLVLTENLFNEYYDFQLIKSFKNKKLYEQVFGIKINTLKGVFKVLFENGII